jgi:hypothetical protein
MRYNSSVAILHANTEKDGQKMFGHVVLVWFELGISVASHNILWKSTYVMKPILSLLVSNYKTYVRKYSINRGIIVIVEREREREMRS